VRKHAKAMVACDFAVAVTLRFRVLYVFLVMEVGSRKLVHAHVTAHPNSWWIMNIDSNRLRREPDEVIAQHRFLKPTSADALPPPSGA